MSADNKPRWSVTPAKAARDTEISDTAFRTLAILGIYTDENGICYPALSTIAKARGITRQAIHKHILELEKAGYLTRKPRFIKGNRTTNLLQVKFDFEPPGETGCQPQKFTPCKPQELTRVSTSEVAQNDVDLLTTQVNDKAGKPARPCSEKRKKYFHPYNLVFAPEIAKLCSLSLQDGSRELCFDAADKLRKGCSPPKSPDELYALFARGGKIYREWPWNTGERLKPMDIVKHYPRLSGKLKPPSVESKRKYSEEV